MPQPCCPANICLCIYIYIYLYIFIERERESNLPIGLDLGLTWFMHASHQAGQYLLCGSFFVSLGPSPLLDCFLDVFHHDKKGNLFMCVVHLRNVPFGIYASYKVNNPWGTPRPVARTNRKVANLQRRADPVFLVA